MVLLFKNSITRSIINKKGSCAENTHMAEKRKKHCTVTTNGFQLFQLRLLKSPLKRTQGFFFSLLRGK